MTEAPKAQPNGHVYEWIIDRQPTQADANAGGAVRIRKYPNGSSSAAVHWSFIGPGVPWQHCHDWVASEDDVVYAGDLVPIEGNHWSYHGWSLIADEISPPDRRSFVAVSRAFGPHGEHYLDAVADDGTAWFFQLHNLHATWQQHTDLPTASEVT